MTTVAAYVEPNSKTLRTTIGGAATPSINVGLREWIRLDLTWLNAAGAAVALPDNTPVKLVIKPVLGHDDQPLALDVTADETGAGAERRYTLKALVDCAALRTELDGKESAEFSLQVASGTEGEEDFFATIPLHINIINCHFRNEDVAPDPAADESLTWLLRNGTLNLRAVTGYTGGGAANLDGAAQPTMDDIGGRYAIYIPAADAPSQIWRVFAGTDATDVPGGIIRPTNYHATTNAVVLKQIA